jgi:hypothetical protein
MFIKAVRHIRQSFKNTTKLVQESDDLKILLGKILANQNALKNTKNLSEIEFKVFSQFGEDGIIQYLLSKINLPNEEKIFVEFGASNYYESNTRFLLNSDHAWGGLVIEGDPDECEKIEQHSNSGRYRRQGLKIECSFITAENINDLIRKHIKQERIGLLSVDIDGNDYHVLKAINCISPAIMICEFNANQPKGHIQQYDPNYMWDKKSAFGSSLDSIIELVESRGYKYVGHNSTKVNAFFVRNS